MTGHGHSLPKFGKKTGPDWTCKHYLGGILSQLQDDKWHSITFILHTMTDAKLNYDIYNKELLAIMYALKEWCPYQLNAHKTFEIWTDHKNLSYFRKAQC